MNEVRVNRCGVRFSSRYAGGDENFVIVWSTGPPDSAARGHSDFTDPKGPLLTSEFSSADVAQALLPAGAETLLGAGEPRSPNACPACARPYYFDVARTELNFRAHQ